MLSPEERLRVLDHIFLRFDELVSESAGALKIETVAGVYLVAANGAPPKGWVNVIFPFPVYTAQLGYASSPISCLPLPLFHFRPPPSSLPASR